MNAVGELVINRTRMLGRLAELEKLAEVLNFSKGRMSDKVTEFQDKYEFSRINSTPLLSAPSWADPLELGSGGRSAASPYGGFGHAGYGHGSAGRATPFRRRSSHHRPHGDLRDRPTRQATGKIL